MVDVKQNDLKKNSSKNELEQQKSENTKMFILCVCVFVYLCLCLFDIYCFSTFAHRKTKYIHVDMQSDLEICHGSLQLYFAHSLYSSYIYVLAHVAFIHCIRRFVLLMLPHISVSNIIYVELVSFRLSFPMSATRVHAYV